MLNSMSSKRSNLRGLLVYSTTVTGKACAVFLALSYGLSLCFRAALGREFKINSLQAGESPGAPLNFVLIPHLAFDCLSEEVSKSRPFWASCLLLLGTTFLLTASQP